MKYSLWVKDIELSRCKQNPRSEALHASIFLLVWQGGDEVVNLHDVILHDVRISRASIGAAKVNL